MQAMRRRSRCTPVFVVHPDPFSIESLENRLLLATIVGGRASPDALDEAIKFRLPLSSDTSVHYYFDRNATSAFTAWNGTTQSYNGHTGTDYSGGPQGRAIYAAADGILVGRVDGFANYSGPAGAAGNYITLSHGNDRAGNPITTTYMHMTPGSPINVPLGTFISAGTQIGGVGASGGATGLHLHFHLNYGGTRYDPYAASGEVSWWNNQGSGSPSTATPPAKFAVGNWVEVFALGGTTLSVRGPNPTSAVIGSQVDGAIGQVIGGPSLSYTGSYNSTVYTRYQVQFTDGTVGWVAQNWLKPGTAPVSATPGTPDLVAGSDTGVSSTDNLTRLNNTAGNTLQYTVGSTIAGATVRIYSDGVEIGSAVASGSTTTVTTTAGSAITNAAHTITAKQTEPSKTISAASGGLSITVDAAAPATPGTSTLAATPTGVTLDWADVSDGSLWGYNVYRSATSGSGYTKINGSTVTVSTYTDNTVVASQPAYYVVRTLDNAGNESGNSAQANFTAPGAATLTTPTNGQSFLSTAPPTVLDFSDVPLAASYDVYLDGVLLANVATSSYTFPTAPAYGPHTWSVTAKNAVGSTASATSNFYIGKFVPGQTVKVNTPLNLKAWDTAASNGTYVLKALDTPATVISGPVFAVGNWRWELLYAGDTVTRWSAEDFLDVVTTAPAAVSATTPTNGQSFLDTAPPTTLDFADSQLATSYDVYLDGVLQATVLTSSYTLPTAPSYGPHTWTVTAKNTVGGTASAVFNFYVGKFLPGQAVKVNSPTGLKAWDTAASNGTYVTKAHNTTATVVSGPVFAAGYWRWELLYAGDSVSRWSAEDFLVTV